MSTPTKAYRKRDDWSSSLRVRTSLKPSRGLLIVVCSTEAEWDPGNENEVDGAY